MTRSVEFPPGRRCFELGAAALPLWRFSIDKSGPCRRNLPTRHPQLKITDVHGVLTQAFSLWIRCARCDAMIVPSFSLFSLLFFPFSLLFFPFFPPLFPFFPPLYHFPPLFDYLFCLSWPAPTAPVRLSSSSSSSSSSSVSKTGAYGAGSVHRVRAYGAEQEHKIIHHQSSIIKWSPDASRLCSPTVHLTLQGLRRMSSQLEGSAGPMTVDPSKLEGPPLTPKRHQPLPR